MQWVYTAKIRFILKSAKNGTLSKCSGNNFYFLLKSIKKYVDKVFLKNVRI